MRFVKLAMHHNYEEPRVLPTHAESFERLLAVLPLHFSINMQYILRINVSKGGRYSIDSRYNPNIPLSRRYYSQIKQLRKAR